MSDLISRAFLVFSMFSQSNEVPAVDWNKVIQARSDKQIATPVESNATTFQLRASSRRLLEQNTGTAFIYRDFVVTNYHVCFNLEHGVENDNFSLINMKTSKITYPTLVGFDKGNDLCILSDSEAVRGMGAEKYVESGAVLYTSRGNFHMSEIFEDRQKDEHTKIGAFGAKKCMGITGDSGSLITLNGKPAGVMWGSQNDNDLGLFGLKKLDHKNIPHYCFFVGIDKVDTLVDSANSNPTMVGAQ